MTRSKGWKSASYLKYDSLNELIVAENTSIDGKCKYSAVICTYARVNGENIPNVPFGEIYSLAWLQCNCP